MALSSRRSGGGVPLFLNVVAPATSNRASVVLRAQPKQPLFWPRRDRRGGRGAAGRSHHFRSRATAGDAGDDDGAPSLPFPPHLVRLATREDLPALVAIERACGHFEWGPEALRHELESPLATLLVAEARGEGGGGRRRAPSSWTDDGGGDSESDKENEDEEQQQRPAGPPPASSASSSASSSLPAAALPASSSPSSSPISGLAIVWTVADETQVLELAVHPSRRRRGAARALLAAALASSPAAAAAAATAAAAGAGAGAGAAAATSLGGRAVLEVASRNEAAVRLYESFGFGVDGIRKGYYRDGDDALLMSLRIGGGGGGGGEEEAEEEEEPRRRRSSGGEGDSAPSSPPTPPG